MVENLSCFYQVQLSSDLTFQRAQELIPYWQSLGVDALYLSPIFASFESFYHLIDPARPDTRLGTKGDLDALLEELKAAGMAVILDIVPNHMSIRGENLWWQDVLLKGQESTYAPFFDVRWEECRGKVLLPILHGSLQEMLEEKAIVLCWEEEGFWIRYGNYKLPLSAASSEQIDHKADVHKIIERYSYDTQLLEKLLGDQFYELADSVLSGKAINYRRFFNINELIGLRIEDEEVFKAHHQLVFDLLESKKIEGLRIDHPDGLYDPTTYFERLQQKKPKLIWVEKILSFGERLPEDWQVDGTVGYEFLNLLSGLFVSKQSEEKMTRFYQEFTQERRRFDEILYERRKSYILHHALSDIDYLSSLLHELSDFELEDLKKSCIEIMACFPVYRTYVKEGIPISSSQAGYIQQAVERANSKLADHSALDFISSFLLSHPEKSAEFVARFQQATAPMMAKGLEDSSFYIYNRLISLNEVGGSPWHFGFSIQEFHAYNQYKLEHYPLGALISSSHDTKMSEDMRLRLSVLSEIPDEWEQFILECQDKHSAFQVKIDKNTEYYLYQLLVGLFPADKDRLFSSLQKAVREAGVYTSWHRINKEYEASVESFLEKVLSTSQELFCSFVQKIDRKGRLNALVAQVLKVGSCGVVGVYQGNETHTLAFVDPDNRRPVDFEALAALLDQDEKLIVTRKALQFRKEHAELFLKGEYIPLDAGDSIVAFARVYQGKEVLVLGRLVSREAKPLQLSPSLQSKQMCDLFTGERFSLENKQLDLEKVFKTNPFALLYSYET